MTMQGTSNYPPLFFFSKGTTMQAARLQKPEALLHPDKPTCCTSPNPHLSEKTHCLCTQGQIITSDSADCHIWLPTRLG